jgi:6,7-dimethyl-8-ribityllumazine synthase
MLTKNKAGKLVNATGARFAIVAACYNARHADSLVAAALDTLLKAGASSSAVRVERVPGTFEIPVIAAALARSGKFDVVIAQGCIIQGATDHARLIAESVANALQQIALETSVPCIFGVVTAANEKQACERCLDKKHNRGIEAARTAIEMAAAHRRLRPER